MAVFDGAGVSEPANAGSETDALTRNPVKPARRRFQDVSWLGFIFPPVSAGGELLQGLGLILDWMKSLAAFVAGLSAYPFGPQITKI